jgi:hypothetical protein
MPDDSTKSRKTTAIRRDCMAGGEAGRWERWREFEPAMKDYQKSSAFVT